MQYEDTYIIYIQREKLIIRKQDMFPFIFICMDREGVREREEQRERRRDRERERERRRQRNKTRT